MRSLFVAGLQTAGVPGDPAATLEQFERNVRSLRATFDGLQLVVAPELHLMALPPLLDEDDVSERELAVDLPGELTERLGTLARETGLWLIPGSVYENAAAPVGNGRSLVVDAEGAVRYEAGGAEEVVTAVLDLDAVRRVRERGAFGINRLWEEMDRVGPGLELPLYGGYRPRPR